MMRDNVVKIKKVDKAKAFVQKFTGPNRPRKRAPFARYILAIHSHSAVEQQTLSVDRYG